MIDRQKLYWQQRYDWLLAQINNDIALTSFKLLNEWQSNMSKAQYSDKFNQIQAYILSGDCYQVNLAQRFKAKYSGDEYKAYQALLADNSPPFATFLRLPEQVILSLSPERFLKLEADIIETKPIKGTRPRFKELSLDQQSMSALQQSEKDRSENLMIVDLLRNDIGRVCQPGSVKVPRLFDIESFPAVHHLVSTVTGKLEDKYQVEDLLKACFPGGSITGAPKIRAMEIIAELEPNRRQSYCGSIGYISNNGKMDTNIAIRTLICTQGEIYCWAGGGLVADSQVDAEYQECFDKVSKILPCLTDL
ncbi:aminodeoxychorismate synthase component I [Psychromonas sp. KJ10-10]|uniref:aminodeoxychorismate synthase component I n=1 Tax=Psychromonas sp. KJ10-10 TaxID=3391823 RepID=UPI0039B396EE